MSLRAKGNRISWSGVRGSSASSLSLRRSADDYSAAEADRNLCGTNSTKSSTTFAMRRRLVFNSRPSDVLLLEYLSQSAPLRPALEWSPQHQQRWISRQSSVLSALPNAR